MTNSKTETYEILASDKPSDVLVCAEHSGINVPQNLDNLGLSNEELQRHIGWDIGISETVRHLHSICKLPVIMSNISRLVVDLNRPVLSDECIPEYSDGTFIPYNKNLSKFERHTRISNYFLPFHCALNEMISTYRPLSLLCLHSFTPQLKESGEFRPWHCGVLFDNNSKLGLACVEHLNSLNGLIVGENQPYQVGKNSAQGNVLHGELKGVPTILLEIRNDEIGDRAGQEKWAAIVSSLITNCFPTNPKRSQISMKAA